MKKLSNVSPFLLLLVPVFIMMVFTFASATTSNQNDDEVALKSGSSKTALIKFSNPFSN
ncbi:hypothetical protein ACXZ1K_02075 [Pedobacter sp. PWIIR3]